MRIEDLFINYRNSFNALDPLKISLNYRLPCAISDADGNHVFTEQPALLSKFIVNCESMNKMGYRSSKFNVLDTVEMSDSAQTVTIGWRVQLAENEIEFRCLYICHLVDQHWRIFSANVYAGAFE